MCPQISVIVPVYNAEVFLKRCLDSVIKQNYKNLQIIVVDDGSTDNSLQIIKKFANYDKRIEVYSKKNEGVATARNYGLSKVKGEYITFVDSDDYINSKMITELFNSLSNHNADMSMCNSETIDKFGNKLKKKYLDKSVLSEKDFWDQLYNGLWGDCTVPWNKLYRKSLFNSVHYENGKTNEDDLILYDLIHQCKRISVVKESLYYHFNRADSITNRNGGVGKKYLDGINAIILRGYKAIQNKQIYLVNYCLDTIPSLMLMQFACRGLAEYQKLKKSYFELFLITKGESELTKRNILRYISFRYFFFVSGITYNFYKRK